jgi:Carboxypeptidase regulatory-like domain/TonB dependent receptor
MTLMRPIRNLFFALSVMLCLVFGTTHAAMAQTDTATILGHIVDSSGASVQGASVELHSVQQGISLTTTTNGAGIYIFPTVAPGQYSVTVRKEGFKQVDTVGVTANVQDHIEQNFRLEIGSTSESVTVTAGGSDINTTDASVSTVVDRHFIENLPLNGRSFQSLLYMTPGVSTNAGGAATNDGASGGFVVNGQRGNENYWLIDGVSGNIELGVGTPGPSGGGAVGATNVVGGTMALVSVDDLNEFRIVTSTFAPEFGRSMGGQIDIQTRSGTNGFHGNVFEYFRNTVFDASNWFNDYYGQPKAPEIQNDFGGVIGGPILKNKAFFFFSYENLRLVQPGSLTATTPDLASRAAAIPAMQPYMGMFPQPAAGAVDTSPGSGYDLYSASYSSPEKAYAASLRVDYQLSKKLNFFARYNHAPSSATFIGPQVNDETTAVDTTKTATAGGTWIPSSKVVNDLRLNYSVSGGNESAGSTSAHGGAPPPSLTWFPSPYTLSDSNLYFDLAFGTGMLEENGAFAKNYQRQWNLVDSLSVVEGTHDLRFGVDYRHLTPNYGQATYWSIPIFLSMSQLQTGTPFLIVNSYYAPGRFKLQNFGAYAQDTWRVNSRMNLTYGLRWDVDFAPQTIESTPLGGITGFSLTSLANLAYAPPGTPPYTTHYGNIAPRIGVNYRIFTAPGRELVLRGGWGIFYGMADSELLNQEAIDEPLYPYGVDDYVFSANFPPTPAQAAVPVNEQPNATNGYPLYGIQPNLNLPWAQEFNVALQQSLGDAQSFTLSYVGARDSRLEEAVATDNPNPNYAEAWVVDEAGSANYNALQAVFQRRLSHGLQALVDYTWAHSIDTGSYGNWVTFIYPGQTSANINENRGDSDYDVRNAFSAALTYQPPAMKNNSLLRAITSDWSTNNIVRIQSGPPQNIATGDFAGQSSQVGAAAVIRPDVVPGVPLYLHGSQYPGGEAVNPAAFTDPPLDPSTGGPTRQGDFPRNGIRSLGLKEWNFSAQREFPIHENIKLRFEADLFNVLNHPNFGAFNGDFLAGGSNVLFGQATSTWANGSANGGQNALYAPGGNRSGQFSLKLSF